jgi:hypothetical protein
MQHENACEIHAIWNDYIFHQFIVFSVIGLQIQSRLGLISLKIFLQFNYLEWKYNHTNPGYIYIYIYIYSNQTFIYGK